MHNKNRDNKGTILCLLLIVTGISVLLIIFAFYASHDGNSNLASSTVVTSNEEITCNEVGAEEPEGSFFIV